MLRLPKVIEIPIEVSGLRLPKAIEIPTIFRD